MMNAKVAMAVQAHAVASGGKLAVGPGGTVGRLRSGPPTLVGGWMVSMLCGGPSYPNAARHKTGARSLVVDLLQGGADQSGLEKPGRGWTERLVQAKCAACGGTSQVSCSIYGDGHRLFIYCGQHRRDPHGIRLHAGRGRAGRRKGQHPP